MALVFGLGFGVLLGELAMRLALSWRARGRLDPSSLNVPTDPDHDLNLQQMLYVHPNPDVIYWLKPGMRGRFLGHPVETNAWGMRDDPVEPAKPEDTLRIVGLGDSYAFGWGVGQQQNYLAFLEQSLGRLLPDRRVEVLNMGCPGFSSWNEAAIFEELGMQFAPDLVLIQYNINDATLPLFLTRRDYLLRFDRIYLLQLTDVLRSGLDQLLDREAGPQWNPRRIIFQQNAPQTNDPAEIPPELRHMVGEQGVRNAYRRLAELCHERGIPLLVLIPTESAWAFLPEADHDPHFDWIRGLCAELDLKAVETFPGDHAFMLGLGEGASDDLLFVDAPNDWHPSVIRHSLWAQSALPQVARALAGDRISTPALQNELDRLREENDQRVRQWHADPPDKAAPAIPSGDSEE